MRLRSPKSRRQIAAAGSGLPGSGPTGIATVVIGTDGSPTSWDAFSWGCGEARRMGGRVVAVFAGADEAPEGQAIAEEAESISHGLDLIFIHAPGDPATELLQVADAVHADLLVVGKSTKVRHRLAGSMGQRLIARRPVPVVVVVP